MKSFDMPIIGDSNEVPQDDPSFTLNLYAEKVSDEVLTLKPTPGSEVISQLSISGGGRGLIAVEGRLFGVRGGSFQEVINGIPVIRGSLLSITGKVGMCFNLKPDEAQGQILIVDATHGYVYNLANDAFTTLTVSDNFQGGGSQCCFCSGRAVVFKPGTTFFQCSDLYDFTTWNDVANSSMQSLNTPLLSVVSNGDLLYGFSSDGFEIWQDQDIDPIFPYKQILAGDKIGILAANSAIFIERHAYWLGKTSTGEGVVYRHSGGAMPERISNHSTERKIAELPDPSDAVADSYNSLGHVFFLLTFQAGNKTMCWDKVTNLWHDRAQRDASTNYIFALPYFSLVVLNGDILGIDRRNGKIVSVDNSLYTDDDAPIIRERILPVAPKEGDYLTFYQSVELFAQYGNTPVGEDDPQVMMKYSTDRGMTWGFERWAQAGGNFTYGGRTRWVGLGAAYGLAFWFRIVCSQYISWRSVRVWAE